MSADWQLHRTGLFWLLLAFAAVIAIHAEHLPTWVNAAAVVVAVWRIQLFRGAWSIPRRLVRYGLGALCIAGLFFEYGQLIGLEPMIALLVSAFALKLLETHTRRDSYLVVFLCFFLAILQALFDQAIVTAVYIFGCLFLTIAALIGLHQQESNQKALQALKGSASLLLQAIPLMLIMFLVMPRIGSLWSVPIQSHSGKTGVSNSMSPGDFSKLGRSAKLAFRVIFDEAIPPQHMLYWRGLVLSNFDGREWTSAGPEGFRNNSVLQWYGSSPQPWDQLIERLGEPLNYRVILEPSQQPWLYALPTPKPSSPKVALTRDFRLVNHQPVVSKTQYSVTSWLDHRISANSLPRWRRAVELNIPDGFNPKTVELARRWRQETPSDKALMRRVLGLYNQQFVYTLEPPLLGKNTVDEFLFTSQRGFCEHFASSFVFFMRAAGVPARVVVGYQGGELHPDNYLVVRQYDAHAWAEVWLVNEGWVRVDPTAAVAPERIESSLSDILADEEGFLADSPLSLVRFKHINWVNNLRLQLESFNYAWAKWVLGYDKEQENVLKGWLGDVSPTRIGLALLVVGGFILLSLTFFNLRNSRPKRADELDQQFINLCRKLEKAGFPRNVGEGPQTYADRIAGQSPEMGRKIAAINRSYEKMRYGNENWSNLTALKKAIKAL